MGLLKPVVEFLVERHARRPWQGPVVTLGVQDVWATREDALDLFRRYAVALPTPPATVLRGPATEKISADEIFVLLGLGEGQSLDKFDAEGATFLHDLCEPIPAELTGRFGLVVDGGALAHVFDVAQGFLNIMRLLRPGGSVVHVAPVAGWENHGFFSINPKLLVRTYASNGFVDLETHLLHVPRDPAVPPTMERCLTPETPFVADSAREALLVVFSATRVAHRDDLAVPVDSHIASPPATGRPPSRTPLSLARAVATLGRKFWSRITPGSRPSPSDETAPAPLHLSELPAEDLLIWKMEPRFDAAYRRASQACGHEGPRDRYYVLTELLASLGRLDADTAECGIYHGLGSHLLCEVSGRLPRHSTFRHHCFDSFQGLSAPGTEDAPDRSGVRTWRGGDMGVPLETVKENLRGFAGLEYHPGWIPECFAGAEASRFAFVHLDVDLYAPTRAALEFFYPRLIRGGILVCDDYGFLTCPGAQRAVDEFSRTTGALFVRLPTGQAYVVKAD